MAKPNPETELQRLRRALDAQGGPPAVIGILGPADFFRREAMDMALAAIDPAAELRILDGSETSDGRELDDLRGASLFGAGCWLAVRRAADWLKSHGPALESVLPARARGCGLVFETAKLDRRTKFGKSIEQHAELFEFRDLYAEPYDRSRSPLEAELVGWLVQRARQTHAMKLAPDAAFLVITSVGQDPAQLTAELERLAVSFAGRAVDVAALRSMLTCSFESTPFEFAEAVLAGDRRRALRSLHAMFARGVRGRDGAATGVDAGGLFPFITSWLFQTLGNTLEGRLLLDAGTPLRDVAARLNVRVFADRFTADVERNSAAWLRAALHELHACQRALRSTGEAPELLLESFLARCLSDARRSSRGGGGPSRSRRGGAA